MNATRRRALDGLIAVLAFTLFTGAQCGGGTPAPRTFAAGALVIPMDNCYQKRDATATTSTVNCNTASDDGIFRAYGLVYFLLKNGVTVYWAIAPAKAAQNTADFTVTAGASPVSKKLNWATFNYDVLGATAQTSLTYIGGPFVIDPADAATVKNLLQNNADFAQFRCAASASCPMGRSVELHEVQAGFSVPSARPLRGVPPRIAILDIGGASASVMHDYAVAAGFDWPCTGTNCAGGVPAPGSCGCPASGATCTSIFGAGSPINNGPGQVYDLLCDADFLPDLATSNLGRGGYKLLWAPHWAGGANPNSCATTTCTGSLSAACALKCQLNAISSFVDTGNNLLAECHSIATIEGNVSGSCNVEPGLPATRFQSTVGMCWNGNVTQTIRDFSHPNTQIGDFVFAAQGGSVRSFFPISPSAYRTGVSRLITGTATPNDWDVFTVNNKDNNQTKGVVAYFGGHTYAGQTAGTRIVLNSMFNLGIPCQDPNTACSTGAPGPCGQGLLKCSPAGGFACVSGASAQPEVCDTLDNDCNGLVDDVPSAACYSADAGTAGVGVCRAGTRVCSGGALSGCQGEVLPATEQCNGLDDDCDGTVDNGIAARSCYDGPPGTETVAPCTPGSQSCAGGTWGACSGQVVPTATATCSAGCSQGPSRACYDGPANTRTKGVCKDGTQTCLSTSYGPCAGQTLPSTEVCNGLDDDCDGNVDDAAPCPATYACTNGVCVPTSCTGEFSTPCPSGYTCSPTGCEATVCGAAICPAGQLCSGGSCTQPCVGVACAQGATCAGGQCVGTGCSASGCVAGKVCLGGSCVDDPCTSTSCPAGTFCRAGDCVRMCLYVTCPAGQSCNADGFCSSDCSPACAAGQLCDEGTCATDLCAGKGCGRGQVCKNGACVDDPCIAAHCPVGTCERGQCVGSADGGGAGGTGGSDGSGNTGGGAGGGGGGTGSSCGCSSSTSGASLAMALLLLAATRRRKPARSSSGAGRGPRTADLREVRR